MIKPKIQRVIITGGSGFVGRWLQEELKKEWRGGEIVSFDLPEVDITQPETYRAKVEKLQPDWVVHLAAVASNVTATQDPTAAERVNVQGTETLLTVISEVSSDAKFLVASTADIYGQGSSSPLLEKKLSEVGPVSSYAKTKYKMEQMIEKDFIDRVVRVRPFPHVGPGQGLGFVVADFASQIVAIEKGEQEPIMKVGNLEAARDFTDVRDVVRAYRLLMEKGELGDVYHVASGVPVKIQTILDMLLKLSDAKIEVQQDPSRLRKSDIEVLVGDATKLRELTGWQPEIELEETLRDVMDWWRGN